MADKKQSATRQQSQDQREPQDQTGRKMPVDQEGGERTRSRLTFRPRVTFTRPTAA